MMKKLCLALLWFGLLSAVPVSAGPYYNSSETGCDGSDTNVAFCEDFETSGVANSPNGKWYGEDCDTANGNGGIGTRTKGWCGSIWANPITPAGAAVCGAGVTPFGNCVGTAGTKSGGTTDVNLALRHLKTSGCGTDGSELCGVTTLYVRWYTKFLTGYSFGAEKHMNFTNSDGDIAFANIQINCGAGSASSTGTLQVQVLHGEDMCDEIGYSFVANKWYFVEMRVTAHATNGTIQVWINDCGTDGTDCGEGTSNPTPTLRYNRSGLRLPGNSNGSEIETIWLESWANPASSGTGPYWDQVKASITGPIGFMDAEADTSQTRNVIFLNGLAALLGVGLVLIWRRYGKSRARRSVGGPATDPA